MNAARIAQIQAKIGSRTDSVGVPRPGYKRNVMALREELIRLQTADAAESAKLAATSPKTEEVDTQPEQGVASA